MWRSFRALREYIIKDKNFHDYCVKERIDLIIMQCMNIYTKSSMLQAQALRVLAALAYGNDKVCAC